MISEQDQRHYLAIARRAVAEAAEVVRTHVPGILTEKGDRDPASEVDLAVERFVRDFLHNKTPEIGFLGEEEGGGHGAPGRRSAGRLPESGPRGIGMGRRPAAQRLAPAERFPPP